MCLSGMYVRDMRHPDILRVHEMCVGDLELSHYVIHCVCATLPQYTLWMSGGLNREILGSLGFG